MPCLYIVIEHRVDHSFEGFDATKEGNLTFGGEKTGLDGVGGELAEVLSGEGEVLAGEAVFAFEIAEEERGVVGGERDHEARVEIAAQGVVLETRATAGFQVRGDADLEGGLALGQDGEQFRIVDGGEGVTEALGADVQGAPDAFRADRFAGVGGEAETGFASFGIEVAERLGGGAAFIPADSNADDRGEARAELGGFAEDAGGFLDAEVANSVKDPIEGEAKLGFGAGAGALHAIEQRLEFATAPVVDHADRDVDLGVNHALTSEAFSHAPGGKLVIVGSAEVLGDRFEGEQKAGEVGVVKEGASLVERKRGSIVAGAELDEGFRSDRSFQMEVQLGFRQSAYEGVHGTGYGMRNSDQQSVIR